MGCLEEEQKVEEGSDLGRLKLEEKEVPVWQITNSSSQKISSFAFMIHRYREELTSAGCLCPLSLSFFRQLFFCLPHNALLCQNLHLNKLPRVNDE